MWHATVHKKVEVLLGQHSPDGAAAWRAVVDSTEDLLTSTVVGRLAYLEGTAAIELLLRAAVPGPLSSLPLPEPIIDSEPWPGLTRDDAGRVEPDWLLTTPSTTWVVEAKWGRGAVPSPTQLQDQHDAVRLDRPGRRILHLVLVQSGEVAWPPGVEGVVVRWGRLRQEVLRLMRDTTATHQRRVLVDVREALDRRGLDSVFLRTLPPMAVEGLFPRWRSEGHAGPTSLPAVLEETILPAALVTPWT